MRALVTGANGFIGSYLTELLLRQGESVALLLRPAADTWRIRELLPVVTLIRGDLLALPQVADQIREFAPDTVFHLAWCGVGNQYRNDTSQVERNLYSSLDLFRLALALRCQTWVGLGSQAEYGPQNRILDETASTSPTTLYGLVKLCVCLLTQQLAKTHDIRFVWLRLFSSYGPKDNPDWLIPYLIQRFQDGQIPSLTAGEQRWDYLYIEDVAQALYQVAVTPAIFGVFNLGSGEAYTLRSIVERVRDLIDPALPLSFGAVPYRPDQVMHLQADVTKLCQAIGWQSRTNLDEGLRKTVAWYRGNQVYR